MEKKKYLVPEVETIHYGSEVIMHAVGGEGSLPSGDFNSSLPAPGRRTDVF